MSTWSFFEVNHKTTFSMLLSKTIRNDFQQKQNTHSAFRILRKGIFAHVVLCLLSFLDHSMELTLYFMRGMPSTVYRYEKYFWNVKHVPKFLLIRMKKAGEIMTELRKGMEASGKNEWERWKLNYQRVFCTF